MDLETFLTFHLYQPNKHPYDNLVSICVASVKNQDIYTCRHLEREEGRHKPTKII